MKGCWMLRLRINMTSIVEEDVFLGRELHGDGKEYARKRNRNCHTGVKGTAICRRMASKTPFHKCMSQEEIPSNAAGEAFLHRRYYAV